MQPQTMNAAMIAQKITNGISCVVIVVFSVAPSSLPSRRNSLQSLQSDRMAGYIEALS
jgi:hypothetical protein